MKGYLAALLVGALTLIAGLASAAQPGGGVPIGRIHLGAVYALSGPIAIYSATIKNALDLALGEVNAGQGPKITMTLEDDRSTQDEPVNIYQKFARRDRVHVIFGPLTGKQVFASRPVAQSAEVPVILTSVATPGVTDGQWIFRTSVESAQIIPLAVKQAVAKFGVKTAALIHAKDDEFTLGELKAFKAALKEHGVEIVAEESYLTGDVDFRAQLTKIKGASPDLLVFAVQGEEGVGIAKQARRLGITAQFIGGNALNSAKVIAEAGEAMEGAVSATPWFIEMNHPENRAFVKKYRERFKSDPDWLAAQTYDAVHVLAKAAAAARITEQDDLQTARRKLRDALRQVEHVGALGPLEFLPNGDPKVSGAVTRVRNGKPVLFR